MKVLVSACILGCNCKYNGGNNLNPNAIDYLEGKEVIKVCPEVLAGMSTPRTPVEIVNNRVVDRDGRDVHAEYEEGVKIALEKIKYENIDLAILQSRSPTCGVNQIYDGTFTSKLIKGSGLFARALIQDGLRVVDSEDFK